MTTPKVEQELERLFAVAREATRPDAGARERVRAGLGAHLTAVGAAPRRAWGWRAWLGIGVAVLGVSAVAVGLRSSAPAQSVAVGAQTPAPVEPAASAPAPEVAPSAAVAADAPPSAPPERAPSSVAPAPLKPAPLARSAETSADPAEELTLVRSMQQALRAGNSGQALALAAEHTRRFPKGNLVEEREGVRAIAQCGLATPTARAKIAEAFARRFASSPYAARVKAACQ